MADEKNLLGLVGICKRAGKTIVGVPMICEHLQKLSQKRSKAGGVEDDVDIIVIEASDTSENTHKKISDKCIYYNVKHIRLDATSEILGKAVGKRATAAVAIADASFCRAILGRIEELI
jgi:hypothetical protein